LTWDREKREEGRRKREYAMYKFMVFVAVFYFLFWDFSGLFSFSVSSFPFILTAFSFLILSFSLSPPSADRR
jgi:hypothetical protein